MRCFREQQGRICKLLVFFVLASLIAFSFVVYYYAHLHVLPNGRIVVHSHALPESGKSHSHSKLELLQLNQFSKLDTALTLVLFAFLALIFVVRYFYFYILQSSFLRHTYFVRRGPPVLSA